MAVVKDIVSAGPVMGSQIIKAGGTASQVLAADGSVKTIDTTVTSGSSNLVTSGAVNTAISNNSLWEVGSGQYSIQNKDGTNASRATGNLSFVFGEGVASSGGTITIGRALQHAVTHVSGNNYSIVRSSPDEAYHTYTYLLAHPYLYAIDDSTVDINNRAALTNITYDGNNTITFSSADILSVDTYNASVQLSSGQSSIALGSGNLSTGRGSISIGAGNLSTGVESIALGVQTNSTGLSSYTEGTLTIAEGNYSHAEGFRNRATGLGAHVEGAFNTSTAQCSHAEGYYTNATSYCSHAEGYRNTTTNRCEHAEGSYNKSNQSSSIYGDAGNTQHSIGIGNSDSTRKNAFEIMQNGDAYVVGIGGYDGTNPNSATRLQDVILDCENITYSALVAKKNAGQLVPGKQYRITDYQCTTAQSNTTSAGHQFDIIVVADSTNKLNEDARAIQHSGDTYFSNSKLESWELKYLLNNDTTRFAWADATNGKGVIYYMKDEFNNECPYDFKNIQFYRKWNSTKSSWCDNGTSSDGVAAYTFSSAGSSSTTSFTDSSLSINNNVYSNVIKEYISSKKQTLNNNCFFGNNCYNNTFRNNCYNNTFRNGCDYNTFGAGCYNNTIGEYCISNTFGSECYNNALAGSCYSNKFGDRCSNNKFSISSTDNTFGNGCSNNTFGSYCSNNSFGSGCYSNSFGTSCYDNTFEYGCNSNSFSDNCCYNTFENYCTWSDFGDYCQSNTFGDYCESNTFGNNCLYNSFGNNCSYNRFASNSTGTAGNYFQHNKLENGVKYCTLYNTSTASSSQLVKNYHIKSSVAGTSSSKKLIEATRNNVNDIEVAMNSDGELVQYCCADNDGGSSPMIEITYSALKALRDGGELVPGMQYRITDFVTTVGDFAPSELGNARSAGHPFDIIVTADSTNTLNESARAALHAGDTYFANSNLEAWELKYCLDNDNNKFIWAATSGAATSGKGVIYYMKDEFENECYYDFKNIQYKRFLIEGVDPTWMDFSSYLNTYLGIYWNGPEGCEFSIPETYFIVSDEEFEWVYTFNNSNESRVVAVDASLTVETCHHNKIGLCSFYRQGYGDCEDVEYYAQYELNNIVFFKDCYYNKIGNQCRLMTFAEGQVRNIFEEYCEHNIMGKSFGYNTFGQGCKHNTFSQGGSRNTFGDNCEYNIFNNSCHGNTFGDVCTWNTFGQQSCNNVFGFSCSDNTFGDNCNNNTFGDNNCNNTFSSDCHSNTFGKSCNSNFISSSCCYNSFGNHCDNNHFGSGRCENNSFGNECSDNIIGRNENCRYITLGDGVRNCEIYGTSTTHMSSDHLQNIKVAQGLQGTYGNKLSIVVAPNLTYETKVGYTSDGTLKIYCEEDGGSGDNEHIVYDENARCLNFVF